MDNESGKAVHGIDLFGHDCIACSSGKPHSKFLHRYYLSETKRLGHPDKVEFVKESDNLFLDWAIAVASDCFRRSWDFIVRRSPKRLH